jgi:hypothetical protein
MKKYFFWWPPQIKTMSFNRIEYYPMKSSQEFYNFHAKTPLLVQLGNKESLKANCFEDLCIVSSEMHQKPSQYESPWRDVWVSLHDRNPAKKILRELEEETHEFLLEKKAEFARWESHVVFASDHNSMDDDDKDDVWEQQDLINQEGETPRIKVKVSSNSKHTEILEFNAKTKKMTSLDLKDITLGMRIAMDVEFKGLWIQKPKRVIGYVLHAKRVVCVHVEEKDGKKEGDDEKSGKRRKLE